MPTYRVRPKFTHGAFNQYKAGDRVVLTEQEAAGFLDKLELVEEVAPGLTLASGGDGLLLPSELAKLPKSPDASAGQPTPTGTDAGQTIQQDGKRDVQPNGSDGGNGTPEPFDVVAATVDEVLDAVGAGKVTASEALIAEQQGSKKRATLIAELTKLVEANGQPKGE